MLKRCTSHRHAALITALALGAAAMAIITAPTASAQVGGGAAAHFTPYAGPCIPPAGFGNNHTAAVVSPPLTINGFTGKLWRGGFTTADDAFNADLLNLTGSLPPGPPWSGSCYSMGILELNWRTTVNFFANHYFPANSGEVVGMASVEFLSGGGSLMCVDQKPLTASGPSTLWQGVANGHVSGQSPYNARVDMRDDIGASPGLAKISEFFFAVECGQ